MWKTFVTRDDPIKAIRDLIDDENNISNYDFSSFWDDCNIENVNVPNFISSIKNVDYVSREGDILEYFIVEGKGIRRVKVLVGDLEIFQKDYNCMDEVIVQPFNCGIIQLRLAFTPVKIIVDSDETFSIGAKYLMLSSVDRKKIMVERELDVERGKYTYINGTLIRRETQIN